MFETLTAILHRLEKSPYAKVPEQTGDGSAENPYEMLHFQYCDAVKDLIRVSMRFVEEHEEWNLYDYEGILEFAGIPEDNNALKKADVSSLDGKTVMAMIVAIVRAERFCDGILLEFCKGGYIQRWLERLKEIDEIVEECCCVGNVQTDNEIQSADLYKKSPGKHE